MQGGEEGEPKEEPPPLQPKEDPYAFTLRHTVFMDLAALPKDVSCGWDAGRQGGRETEEGHLERRLTFTLMAMHLSDLSGLRIYSSCQQHVTNTQFLSTACHKYTLLVYNMSQTYSSCLQHVTNAQFLSTTCHKHTVLVHNMSQTHSSCQQHVTNIQFLSTTCHKCTVLVNNMSQTYRKLTD